MVSALEEQIVIGAAEVLELAKLGWVAELDAGLLKLFGRSATGRFFIQGLLGELPRKQQASGLGIFWAREIQFVQDQVDQLPHLERIEWGSFSGENPQGRRVATAE